MKQKQKTQIAELINALKTLGYKKNEDVNFLPMHIDRAICNPFKISYIKKNDLENLIKTLNNPEGNTGYSKEEIKELKKARVEGSKIPSEIRVKFFKATNIEKFFKSYFLPFSTDAECTLFTRIIEKFKLQFYGEMNFKFKAFEGEDIAKVYANELENFTVLKNGSCMQNEPLDWFEIYTKCDNLKIITLHIDKTIVARGLLWEEKSDLTREAGELKVLKESKKESNYFLDRIYTCSEFDEDTREKLQTQLYMHALKYTKQKFINCASQTFILRYLRKDKKANVKAIELVNDNVKSEPSDKFSVYVDGAEFDYYPYCDTMKNYEIIGNSSILSYKGERTVYLDCTDGHDNSIICDACQDRLSEEEEHYSDVEEVSYCRECSVYLEDRGTYCYSDNATYDNFREVYIYANDIE